MKDLDLDNLRGKDLVAGVVIRWWKVIGQGGDDVARRLSVEWEKTSHGRE